MKRITDSLGFRLTATSFLVVSVFIFVAGVSVYNISKDAIQTGLTRMVQGMARDLPKDREVEEIGDALLSMKIAKAGTVWLMDGEGRLLFHSDPRARRDFVETGVVVGDTEVTLQFAQPRKSGTGTARVTLADIVATYEEGFGEYRQYGETRLLAFEVLKDKGWLVGVDEPKATAISELERIKKYIRITGLVSAILILVFTWLAIRIIVRPYYREVEELNRMLQSANRDLSEAYEKLESSNRKLASLYRIGITMQESLSLQDILDLIASGTQEVLALDRIGILLPDQGETVLQCRAAIGAGDRPPSAISVPLSPKGGALAAAYKRGQTIRVEQGEHLPPHFRLPSPWSEDPFLRSSAFVVVPMVVKNRTVGVIAVDNKSSGALLTDDMVDLIQVFANQAAVAVENARLYEDLKRNIEALDARVDQLSIVNQISNTMQTMVKRKEMLGFILRGIKESMGFDQLMVCLVDGEEDAVRGEAAVGVAEERVPSVVVPLGDEGSPLALTVSRSVPTRWAAASDDIAAVLSGKANGQLREGDRWEGASMALALIPMRVLVDVAGVLAAARTRDQGITKQEMELLMLFANTAGLAVERASLYERIERGQEEAEFTDTVTRLFTLKYGEQRAAEEVARAAETGRPLSVAVLGVDAFKEYNDRCGRELGDRALVEIAGLVRMVLTDGDLAYRYGGRLIACLFPGKPLLEAEAACEKIVRLVAGHRFEGPAGEGPCQLTVSAGAVEFRGREREGDQADLLKAAMSYLHRAEAAGGNRVLTA